MKSTLLTSTALIAFAGAAAAQDISGLSFTGDASLGYTNDSSVNDNEVDNTRFFWEANLDVTLTQELDNGLTASALVTLGVIDGDIAEDAVTSSDYVLTLSGPNAVLQFGDVDPVAEDRFNIVDGNEVDFADQDTYFDLGYDAILIGEGTFGAWTGAFSAGVNADAEALIDDSEQEQIDGFQLFVTGTVSIIDIELAFQDDFFVLNDAGDGVEETDTTFGILLGTTVANANLAVSYIDDTDESSLGFSADYPIGPVTVGGYYTINDEADDNYGVEANYATEVLDINAFYDVDGDADNGDDAEEFGVEGVYRVGDSLEIYAGYLDGDLQDGTYYVAGEYDLGGGAEIILSYADDGNDDANVEGDEIGDPEYNEGATIEVTFEF